MITKQLLSVHFFFYTSFESRKIFALEFQCPEYLELQKIFLHSHELLRVLKRVKPVYVNDSALSSPNLLR